MNTTLALLAAAIAASSGVLTVCSRRTGLFGQRLAALLHVLGALLGGTAAVAVLAGGDGGHVTVQWTTLLPQLQFGLDALSAMFLLPVCLLAACAAIYDLAYWRQTDHLQNGRQLRLFFGLLTAGLMLVLLAQDGIGFLLAWEVMALCGFFLVATEHEHAEVRDAGWIYLVATHLGTLLLVALFCVWQGQSGGFLLQPLAAGAGSAGGRDAMFVLALLGFGLKAGIVPLHFWLPPAHANAPSHVSAVMSGVLIKMGIYGIARTVWLLPQPPVWWGVLLLLLGASSAVIGVAFAIGQHDLKRLLAYHSIENIGIICMGLGLALLGRATGHLELLALGLGGALLHVWNHGLFKGLLFLSAGAVIHHTGTRQIDRLGGLLRAMPATAACFLVGAVAICGLPPLNGFVSELLTYLGLFRALEQDGPVSLWASLVIPALAVVGAMALLCFVKVFGVVFLGAARSDGAARAQPAERPLRLPMYILALGCFAIGLLPMLALPALQRVIGDWTPTGQVPPSLALLAPFTSISGLGLMLVGAGLAALLWLWQQRLRAPAATTWDCGYVDASSPRLQYSAGSFAQMFVQQTARLLWPVTHRPGQLSLFPTAERFASHVPDPVLDRLLRPALRGIAGACNWLRLLQRGRVQVYLFYMFLCLLLLLLRK